MWVKFSPRYPVKFQSDVNMKKVFFYLSQENVDTKFAENWKKNQNVNTVDSL